jgi:hypothetical protein
VYEQDLSSIGLSTGIIFDFLNLNNHINKKGRKNYFFVVLVHKKGYVRKVINESNFFRH